MESGYLLLLWNRYVPGSCWWSTLCEVNPISALIYLYKIRGMYSGQRRQFRWPALQSRWIPLNSISHACLQKIVLHLQCLHFLLCNLPTQGHLPNGWASPLDSCTVGFSYKLGISSCYIHAFHFLQFEYLYHLANLDHDLIYQFKSPKKSVLRAGCMDLEDIIILKSRSNTEQFLRDIVTIDYVSPPDWDWTYSSDVNELRRHELEFSKIPASAKTTRLLFHHIALGLGKHELLITLKLVTFIFPSWVIWEGDRTWPAEVCAEICLLSSSKHNNIPVPVRECEYFKKSGKTASDVDSSEP